MNYSKVIVNNNTVVDLTADTINAASALSGRTFHKSDGAGAAGNIATYNGATTITSNGSVATSGKYMASNLTVAVPQPSGTVNITQNGTYDVTSYASADVAVSGGDEYQRPADWLAIPTLDTTKDDIYILMGVSKDGISAIGIGLKGAGTIDWGDGSALESFNESSIVTHSHFYTYSDISSSTWTDHNNTRQALIHIQGDRNNIQVFQPNQAISFTAVNGVANSQTSAYYSSVYEVDGNVSLCGASFDSMHQMEIFSWSGILTAPVSAGQLVGIFNNCYQLKKVSNLTLDSSVADISYFFSACYSLTSAPEINTSNVTNISYMFQNCYSLRSVPTYNTQNCQNFYRMFYFCYSLEEMPTLDLSSATTTAYMFYACNNLKSIPKIDLSHPTDISYMFSNCRSLKNIPDLNTKNATNMWGVFANCESLVNAPHINTSSCTRLSGIFSVCSNLRTIHEIDGTNATDGSIFYSAGVLSSVKIYNLAANAGGSITLSNLTPSIMMTEQNLLDLFNSLPTMSGSPTRTLQLGTTLQQGLSLFYVKDSGTAYTAIIPTSDTSIVSGKTYYTYNNATGQYTAVTPDFSTDTFYFEGVTATWNKYVICPSTDTGAMTAIDFMTNVKHWTIT